jgi:hypothetical protein
MYCFHIQGCEVIPLIKKHATIRAPLVFYSVYSSTLKIEAALSYGTSVNF